MFDGEVGGEHNEADAGARRDAVIERVGQMLQELHRVRAVVHVHRDQSLAVGADISSPSNA